MGPRIYKRYSLPLITTLPNLSYLNPILTYPIYPTLPYPIRTWVLASTRDTLYHSSLPYLTILPYSYPNLPYLPYLTLSYQNMGPRIYKRYSLPLITGFTLTYSTLLLS